MFAYILVVILVAILISAFAERRNIQPALLVAMVGLGASFIPAIPRLELEPDVILGIVLPPMLFSAARDFSFAQFSQRMGSILNLGVLLVFVTTLAIAAVAMAVVPGITPLAALVLGAVIAPPDALAAIAIGRRAGLPVALMTVLKGESLINDAAALTLFTVLVATAAGAHAFIDNIPLYFLYAALVGIVVGFVIGYLAQIARRKLGSPSLATAVSVIVPFAAFLVAEELHASGVLAVVAAGFALGHHAVQSGYEERIQESQFWRTVDTLLETFVFAYIGLQLRFVIDDAEGAGLTLPPLLGAAIAILVVATLVRFGWIFVSAILARRRHTDVLRRMDQARATGRFEPGMRRGGRELGATQLALIEQRITQRPLTQRENVVLSWTGMRGVVTLAAAAGVPLLTASGEGFPNREAILALAFLVTIGTLLVQGLSLPWLIERLDLADPADDAFKESQHALATTLAREATREALTEFGKTNTSAAVAMMIARMQKSLAAEETQKDAVREAFDSPEAHAMRSYVLEARRNRLIAARDAMELDDTIVREMLEQMDREQAVMVGWGTGLKG
jgi:monovalent cation/hydrogen antiporter